MPRWKALPDGLDPQLREFNEQLRRLVDRGGLSVATVAERTGYSRPSWERYLNGRLLAPKGAAVALAEVVGVDPAHVTTMWELAERAWSRSQPRHDVTMEAARISKARAALGEFGPPPRTTATGEPAPRNGPSSPTGRAAVAPGGAGPAGVAPTVPPGGGPGPAAPESAGAGRRGRRTTMFLAGLVGVLVLIAVVFTLAPGDNDKHGDGARGGASAASPTATAAAPADLPAGVKCSGAACTGRDAEAMGCSGDLVTTTATATVGTVLVEVRYSRTCGAAWGRVTRAAPGDEVTVTVGKHRETGTVDTAGDSIAYTPMLAVSNPSQATVCATLTSGPKGCAVR
ncbi:helix-turn-helix domain-containing protein [Streptomyces sp. NPDC090306]|uniref:helix-turn-helix domain-containing protein n=1 Tax=Streptomyces sp. NPDC090306 TaxID=3365961 RepID=UPI00380B4751